MAAAASISPSRQRVLDALAHRTPDRIPIDFGSSTVCGIHALCVAELRDYYGLEKRPVKIFEPFQMLGLIDDDLRRAMGVDVEGVYRRKTMFGFENKGWKEWRFHGRDMLVSEAFVTTTDANGDLLIHPEGDIHAPPSGRMPQGFYFFDAIIRQNHFDEDNLDPADNTEEFKVLSDADLAGIAEDVRVANETGRAVVANLGGMGYGDIALVPAPFLKDPRGIRDITEWYVSLSARKDYVHKIFERQTEVALANLERGYRALGDSIDVLYVCGTDFGTQTSSFCSVATFRELWLPYYQAVCGWVHRHTPWKCFKHSCGSVARFYDSFIDAGFDIVNPVQCSAAGMDPEQLKERYGSRLVFWGGGVDTQKVLPFGTPEEVRRQVLERCGILGRDGGFVFNTIHNIQAETPVKNIVAMVNALKEFNGN